MTKKDFTVKTKTLTRGKKGKREYLNDSETNDLMKELKPDELGWAKDRPLRL